MEEIRRAAVDWRHILSATEQRHLHFGHVSTQPLVRKGIVQTIFSVHIAAVAAASATADGDGGLFVVEDAEAFVGEVVCGATEEAERRGRGGRGGRGILRVILGGGVGRVSRGQLRPIAGQAHALARSPAASPAACTWAHGSPVHAVGLAACAHRHVVEEQHHRRRCLPIKVRRMAAEQAERHRALAPAASIRSRRRIELVQASLALPADGRRRARIEQRRAHIGRRRARIEWRRALTERPRRHVRQRHVVEQVDHVSGVCRLLRQVERQVVEALHRRRREAARGASERCAHAEAKRHLDGACRAHTCGARRA